MRTLLFLASLLVFFVAFGEAVLPRIGSCTFREGAAKERACVHTFFQTFRRNPKANCGVYFAQMKTCVYNALYSCLRGYRTPSQVRVIVNNAYGSQSKLCSYAGVDIFSPQHKDLPCSSSYRTRQIACSSTLRSIWSRNRGDPRLCRENVKLKNCEKVLMATLCRFTGVTKELLDFAFDSYNPFCVSGRDPTSIPQLPTTKQPTVTDPKSTAKTNTPKLPTRNQPAITDPKTTAKTNFGSETPATTASDNNSVNRRFGGCENKASAQDLANFQSFAGAAQGIQSESLGVAGSQSKCTSKSTSAAKSLRVTSLLIVCLLAAASLLM